MPRPTFRPGLLALAIALAVPAPFLHAAPAEQASVRDYRIAAGPLAGTLNRIAAQAGLVLTLDPALAEGRSAHAVQGRFDAPGALREALKGSGLELVENAGGTYSLRKVPEDTLSLQAMTVSGAEEDPLGPTSGYVAKRSMTGTKTDTPILETPRSISVATRQQMTDRAVHNLDDAVRYMPGVVASSFGSDSRSAASSRPSSSMDCRWRQAHTTTRSWRPGIWSASPCSAARPPRSTARPRPAACSTWSACARRASPAMN